MEEAFPRQWLFFEKFPATVAADPAVAIAATRGAGDEPLKGPGRPVLVEPFESEAGVESRPLTRPI
jgi:hypothetical protein